MSLMMYVSDIESDVYDVKHNIGSQDISVTVWQNGYTITPNILAIDKDTLRVYQANGGRIVLIGFEEKPLPKKKPAARKKAEPNVGA